MPFLGYFERDEETGQFPETTPFGRPINDALDAICPIYNDFEQWQRNVFSDLAPGSGGGALTRLLTGRNAWDILCAPYGGIPFQPAPMPGVPTFPTNCETFGVINWQNNVGQTVNLPTWIPAETRFNCGDNWGRPIGQPFWKEISPGTWGYVLLFENASGGGTRELVMTTTPFGNDPRRNKIDSIEIQYCPGCNLPPPPPVFPEPPIVNPEQPRPIINIPITIPGLPGQPDIDINIPYSPVIDIDLPINLQPLLTLEPNIDISPQSSFAPTFEFNLGGVSIGGGGYAEPRQDVQDLLECDCPDPCTGTDVDYDRIRLEGLQNLSVLRDLPGERTELVPGDSVSGLDVFLELPEGCVGVRYVLDLSAYLGDTVFGRIPQTTNYYAGWYWFGDGVRFGGDRQYFTASSGFLPVPPFARSIAASCRKGASVTLTPVTPVTPGS